jgi:hypothetical protein
MKFELLQKHSRQVKLVLHFRFFYDKNIDNFVHEIHKQKKHFPLLKAQRYAILLRCFFWGG